MQKMIKYALCVLMVFSIVFSFAGCSGNVEITEDNVTKTVDTVQTALKEFDQKKLEKYVDSSTLNYILKLADDKEQYGELGKAIFENLSIEIDTIDVENKTVSVNVKNKDLYNVASSFTNNLMSNYNKLQLINLLNDDDFLNSSLSTLVDGINSAQMNDEVKTVELNISQGKKNLVLGFDDTAEDAVSGGALTAIKNIVG